MPAKVRVRGLELRLRLNASPACDQSCNKKEMFKIKIKILGLKIKIKTSGFEIKIGSLKIKNKIFTCQAQDSKLCDHTATSTISLLVKTSKFKDCMLSDAKVKKHTTL